MVRIRLTRTGLKKQPSYRVVVADRDAKRDGRILELIGHYNPRTEPLTFKIQEDRALYWLSVGAGGHAEAIDEARAGGTQIKGPGPASPQIILYQAGGRGKHVFRGSGGDNDEFDLRGIQVGTGEGARGRFKGHRRGGFPFGYPAFTDAGAGINPLMVCLHMAGDFLVCQNTTGQETAPAGDMGV